MKFETKKRKFERVDKAIKFNASTSKWIAAEKVQIIFPKRYINGKLGNRDDKFNVVAIFCIILEDGSWDVCSICSIMPLTPSEATTIKINGIDYFSLIWEAGDVICPNVNLVQRNNLAFEIYDEFVAKTRLPPYFDNLDHSTVLDSLEDFTGVNLNANLANTRIYNSTTARNPKDRTQPIRELFKKQSDFFSLEVDFIPLNSVAFGADNTTARLAGSYQGEGINSALVNPSEKIEPIEQILTS